MALNVNLSSDQIPVLCRICLKKDENAVDIDQIDLSTIFETVLHEKLIKDDEKPQKLCTQCINCLNQYYGFLDVYNQSKLLLENYLRSKQLNSSREIDDISPVKIDVDSLDIQSKITRRHSKRNANYCEKEECDICGRKVKSSYLSKHKELQHDIKVDAIVEPSANRCAEAKEECNICGRKVKSSYLIKHKEVQHDIKTEKANDDELVVCHICGLQIPYRNLKRHCKSKHEKAKAPKKMCELCGRQFGNKTALNDHYKIVHEGIRYDCHLCPGKSYTTSTYLKEHIERKHTHKKPEKVSKAKAKPSANAKWLVVCEICGQGIPRSKRRRLILHDAYHRYGHKVMCQIPDCELTFADTPARLRHMANDHEKLTCDQCHKDFFDRIRFQAHCEVHIWENNSDFDADKSVCRICNQHFKSDPSLAEHLLKTHKIYWCLEKGCSKLFITRGAFALDRTNHKKMSKFKCSYCPREFTSEKSHAIHEKGHNKAEGFKCTICGYMFEKPNKLKVHMRTHTGEKPFQCSFCPKSFISISSKKTHERYHTGEKPYVCQYCNRGFASKTIYNRHIDYEMRTNKEAATAVQNTNENI